MMPFFRCLTPFMQSMDVLLALSLCKGIGPKTLIRLLDRFRDLRILLNFSRQELLEHGLPKALTDAIATCDVSLGAKALAWQKDAPHRHIIAYDSPLYPALLKEIASPPALLYAEGDLSCLQKPCVAIVGTRQPSHQGAIHAQHFAEILAGHGYCIVSGLAGGIDSKAHQGSLAQPLASIAVMGTGIDVIYPQKNKGLARKIMENGLILTEFPLNTRPLAGHFPRRNRIISGLSLCTLVVEAAIQSGTMVTARLALEQNREVMAIPGSINNPNSAGCHYLIKEGALLVTSPEEVVEALGILPKVLNQKASTTAPERESPLLAFFNDALTSFDELLLRSKLGSADLSGELIALEMTGAIESVPGGYQRCKL